jgi:putative spermidine/putrescine transport system substrate-binding protein
MKAMSHCDPTRRELFRRLGFTAAAFPLSWLALSCRRGSSQPGTTLNFFSVGTLNDGASWQRAEHELGTKVVFRDNQNDVGQVITQMITLGAGKAYDVGGLLGGAERELAQARTILPWDLNKIPNYKGIWPQVLDISTARVDGRQYGLPIAVNADSMIYLPEKTGTVDSYHAVFDRNFRGRTSMEDSWMNSVFFTAMYLKESSQVSIVDPSDLTVPELHEVMEFLTKQKRDGQFLKFWSGWEEGVDLITSGDVWVMTGWEPIVYEAQKRGVKAKYAKPKEGYEAWSTDLLLHVGAQDRHVIDAAHAFANWALGGFYGCQLALERGYVVPNDKAAQYIDEHDKAFTADQVSHIRNTVDGVKAKFSGVKSSVYWLNVRPNNIRAYEDLWSTFRAS